MSIAELPTEDDVAFYRQHGWYISKPLFTEAEIDEMAAAADRFYAGHRDGDAPVEVKPFLAWKPECGHDVIRMNDHIVFQSAVIRRFALDPIIGEVAARLAAASQIRLFNSSMAYKPPGLAAGKSNVGWHTDRAYWQTCSSDRMLTAWIPLHDCTVEMGPVSFIDASHRWDSGEPRVKELVEGKTFITDDFDELQRKLQQAVHTFEIVPAVMKKGQVSFHHCRLFHGSLANTSTRPRLSLIVHMQDGENRFRVRHDRDGNRISYNTDTAARKLPDGTPDYRDPRLFPSIWPESDQRT